MSSRCLPARWNAALAASLLMGVLLQHPAIVAPSRSRAATRGRARVAQRALAQPVPRVPLPLPTPVRRGAEVSSAAPPPGDAFMPVSEIRAGMKGYGLTVFRGTKIERFEVEILGVLPKLNMGQPLILVRLSGGPISERGAYLIQGMSGSPIYVDGKLLGAFSMGDAWPKEPIGMVTPIQNMLEALDPKLSKTPAGLSALDLQQPVSPILPAAPDFGLFGAAGAGFGGALPPGGEPQPGRLRPLALPVTISGLTGSRLDRAAQALRPLGLNAVQGPGSLDQPFAAELTPGAAVGVALMTGDVEMTAIGTVTYRKGNDLVAFGHPMMQLGPADFPITTAWIHDVFSGYQISHKIGSAGKLCGTLTQDRPFSIAARVGPLPQMVPITYSVKDRTSGRSKTFHVQAANHPLLVGQLLPIAVNQGLFEVRPVPGDAVAHVKMRVETEGAGVIERENVFFDPLAIDVAAVRELVELMGTLANNTFRRVPIKSLSMEVEIEEKRPTATVERVFLAQDRFEPGEEIEVGVVLRPYRRDPVLVKTRVRVPATASDGRAVLLVQGGATRIDLGALMAGGGLSAPPADGNLQQVLRRFATRERNDQLVVRMLFSTIAANVRGERLSQLPSHLMEVMRSARSTGFRLDRDESRDLHDTNYVVQGLQSLAVTIQKPDHAEKTPSAGPGGGVSIGSGLLPTGGRGSVTLSAGSDADDLSVIRLTVDGRPVTLSFGPEPGGPGVPAAQGKKDEVKPADPKPAPAGAAARGGSAPGAAPARSGAAPAAATPTPVTPGAAPAPTAPDATLVGRVASVWKQSTRADFARGEFTNAAVTTGGEVRLAPGLNLLHASPEQFVWSVAAVRGAVFAGTGNGGQVLRIGPDGDATVFFNTGELEVHALARDAQGNLYAGTSPNGQLFRIGPDGKGVRLLSMNPAGVITSAGSKFVLSLVTAPDGTVYAGTGPQGRIYRIQSGSAVAEEWAAIPGTSVTSLLLGKNGSLYAGVAEEGAVYQVSTDGVAGSVRMLYDSPQAAVTGLVQDAGGILFAATAPSGEIYRIEPDGSGRVYFNKAGGALYGLIADGRGVLYAGSANSVVRVETDADATFLTDEKRAQFTCLAWDEAGRMIAGSANTGSVYRVTPTPTGKFDSTIHDAKLPARWGRVRFTGLLPSGGTLTLDTRSGNSPEPDATWSEWQPVSAEATGTFVRSPAARFLQYRVQFQAEQGSPLLRDVAFYYMPRNQPPRLTLAAPLGGEIWRGTQALKWSAEDPDKDTLTYVVSYSADNGRTWHAVGEPLAALPPNSQPGSATPPRSSAVEDALKRFREQLDMDMTLTAEQRESRISQARGLVDQFLKENPPMGAPPRAAGSGTSGITRQATLNWDTKAVPDGVYVLRVVATDRASNPADPETDVRVTEPFVVANTAPVVFLFERGVEFGNFGIATIRGFASGRVGLKGAQFRLGAGEWQAVESEDGLWDSPSEQFRFDVTPVGTGEQIVEVKVVDYAGNVQLSRVRFKPAAPTGK